MRRNTNTAVQDPEATVCDACQLVPLTILALDIDEPVAGWEQALAERGIEMILDDLGRRSVPRNVLGELLAEHREREALVAAQRAEQAARRDPVPAGVPALADATAYESLVAAGLTTPKEEFGRRPAPNFLDEELAAGQRQAADERAEAELLSKARRVLDGRADR